MKRELSFALSSQTHPTDLLGRTRASKSRTVERLRDSTETQCRTNGSSDQRKNQYNAGTKPGSESAVAEVSKVDFDTPACDQEEERRIVVAQSIDELPVVVTENDLAVEGRRRFTRSALKRKAGDSESGDTNVESEGIMDIVVAEGNGVVAASGRTRPKKSKLQRPTNIKELLQSRLLEGCPVFYNAGKKKTALRGLIKDNGILCSCSLCNGSKVIMPSQFELHACNSYRHAAKFICLENGKNLLDVIDACLSSSIEALEETVNDTIASLPSNESIICPNCNGKACNCSDTLKSPDSTINESKMSTNKTGGKARSSERVVVLKSNTHVEVCMSSQKNRKEKSPGKRTPKSQRPALYPKSPISVGTGSLSENKTKGNVSKKLSKTILHASSSKSDAKKCPKITKKDQRMHWLVFEEDGLPDGTEVAYYSHGKKLLEGYKKGAGIFCFCCNSVVSASQFEAHAGLASRKKPYGNIYTSNGVSLHELAISLLKGRKYSDEDNDDLCAICADGGDLLLCDGCPRSFHKECASLASIPRGKWYCKYCENMFQRERYVKNNANALAAGRVSGVDPIEEITKRCVRIVKNPQKDEVIACVLCRGADINKSGFGPNTVILCDQCEKEYHVGCLKKNNMADLKELPKGEWFCCTDCGRIHTALQDLLKRGPEKIPESDFDIIKKKLKDKAVEDDVTNFDVSWRVMSGKISSGENRSLLSEAVALLHDRFDPIIDSATGRDFIPSMVYGRTIKEHDFGGMYCAILTVNSTIVSVGTLRIFGCGMAELPLVATSIDYQGKGYFQLLFSCIQKLLAFLNVTKLVLPAADEAGSIWLDRFGFQRISPAQLTEYRKDFGQLMTFQGTSMLEKPVPQCRVVS